MAENVILTRLDGLKAKYEDIGQQMTEPDVISDMKRFVALNKEYKELKPIIAVSERYKKVLSDIAEAKDVLANEKDEDMKEMAKEELAELEPQVEKLEEEIKLLLIAAIPKAMSRVSKTPARTNRKPLSANSVMRTVWKS